MEQFHHHFDPNYWKKRTRRQNKCDIQMACFNQKKKKKERKKKNPTISSLKPAESDNLDGY